MKTDKWLDELQSVMERVRWIYSNYQDAINRDEVLIAIYGNYFGNTKYREDTIKRMGRYWRASSPGRFIRPDEKKVEDEAYQDVIKGVVV